MVRWAHLEGLLVPVDWDEGGGVRTVAVLTNDEREFLVRGGPPLQRLQRYLRRRVHVTGWVGRDDQGRNEIAVEIFRIAQKLAPPRQPERPGTAATGVRGKGSARAGSARRVLLAAVLCLLHLPGSPG